MQHEQVNIYNMEQTTSQVMEYNQQPQDGDDKNQLIRQLMDVNSQKQLGNNLRKRLSQLDKDIDFHQNNSLLQHTSFRSNNDSYTMNRQQQQNQQLLNNNSSGSLEKGQNLRDHLKQQNSQQRFKTMGAQANNQGGSQTNSFINTSNVNTSQAQQQQVQNSNIYSQQYQQSQQKQDQDQEQYIQNQFQFYDPRKGNQRSEELYLKGLKNRIEQDIKVKQIMQERKDNEMNQCSFSPDITRKARNLQNYMDIVQKTEIHYIRKNEREMGRQNEIEVQRENTCTFSPKFCKKSLMTPSSQEYENKKIYERQIEWQKKVQEKRQQKDQQRWDSIVMSPNTSMTTKRSVSRTNKSLKPKSGSVQPHLRRPQTSTYYDNKNNTTQNRSFSNLPKRKNSGANTTQLNYSNVQSKSRQGSAYSRQQVQSPASRYSRQNRQSSISSNNSNTVQDKLNKLLQTTDTKKSDMLRENFSPIKNEINDTLQLFNRIKTQLKKNQTGNNSNNQQQTIKYNTNNKRQPSRQSSRANSQVNGNRKDSVQEYNTPQQQNNSVSSYKQQRLASVSPDVQTTHTLKPRLAKNNRNKIQDNKQQVRASRSPQFSRGNRLQYEEALSPNKVQLNKYQKIGLNNNRYVFLNKQNNGEQPQLNGSSAYNTENNNQLQINGDNKENSQQPKYVTDSVSKSMAQISPRSSYRQSLNSERYSQVKNKNQKREKENEELKNLIQMASKINNKIKNLAGSQNSDGIY